MPTKKQIIDDAQLRWQGGKPSDDWEFPDTQVEHWINSVYGDIARSYIENEMDGVVPGGMWAVFECLKATKGSGCVTLCGGGGARQYIELKTADGVAISVLNLPDEAGIKLMKGGKEITRYGSKSAFDNQRKLPGVGSLENRTGWYRAGDRLYLVSSRDVLPFERFELWVVLGSIAAMDATAELPIPDELVGRIMEAVVPIGWQQLQGVNDIVNDGKSGNHDR